jgi:HEAT repeat protein
MGPFAEGWNESDVEAVVARGKPEELLYVPIVVGMNAHACDRGWAEDLCFKLAEHPNFNVRGNAILGLSHIARTCRSLNLERAIPAVQKALTDESDYVRGHAEDVVADLQVFLNIAFPPRVQAK